MIPFIPVLLIHRLIPETEKLLDMGVSIGLALVIGFVAQRLLFVVVHRVERWITIAGRGSEHARQRSRTIGQILRNLCTTVIGVVVVIYGLGVLGWDVRPLLAGAGILGVALGFGAQTLVRDIIAGLFIIGEDQFSVGDLIEVNGRAATVEALTVRCATLRDFNGHLHFVPNGEMKIVVNRSRGWQRMAVDVPVGAAENLDQALAVCTRVAAALSVDPAWQPRLLDAVQVWGIESLGPQIVQIRMVVRGRPGADPPEAARELRRRVHRALVEAGVRPGVAGEISISPMAGFEGQAPVTQGS